MVLFDGLCNLCNATVRFLLSRDRRHKLFFGSLQSEPARQLLAKHYSSRAPDSIVLIESGRAYDRSTAALRISRHLNWPWPLLYGFIIIPRSIRDWLYDRIARHRYRWFGRQDNVCELPGRARPGK